MPTGSATTTSLSGKEVLSFSLNKCCHFQLLMNNLNQLGAVIFA